MASPLRHERPVLVAIDEGRRSAHAVIELSGRDHALDVSVHGAGDVRIPASAARPPEFGEVMSRQLAVIVEAAAQDGAQDRPVFRSRHERPDSREASPGDVDGRHRIRPSDTRRVVIGVDGNDVSHATVELRRSGQRNRRAHRFPCERDVREIERLHELDDGTPQRMLRVIRARCDVRPTHAGKVDRMDGKGIGELRDHELEVIELRANGVQ